MDYQLKSQINQAVRFVQQHWQQMRGAAADAYRLHGRGAFLFNLRGYPAAFKATPAEFIYLNLASVGAFSNAMARALAEAELDTYNPQRQIDIVFWHPESEDAFIRVQSENPDGTPRTGFENRWNNAPRACPKCGTEFIEPQCGHEFLADYDNQKTDMVPIPPIVDV